VRERGQQTPVSRDEGEDIDPGRPADRTAELRADGLSRPDLAEQAPGANVTGGAVAPGQGPSTGGG
jgi:hypothetical protein